MQVKPKSKIITLKPQAKVGVAGAGLVVAIVAFWDYLKEWASFLYLMF